MKSNQQTVTPSCTNYMSSQYSYVKDAREALFSFCSKMPKETLLETVSSFGHKSIKNVLVHTANVYIHWIANFALNKEEAFFDEAKTKSLEDIRSLFTQTDLFVELYIERFKDDEHFIISGQTRDKEALQIKVLKLFTHVITHEFHHKGQVLAMSRILGHTPADTDIIRF